MAGMAESALGSQPLPRRLAARPRISYEDDPRDRIQDLSVNGETLIDDDGIWIEIAVRRWRPRLGRRAALFLDRDGVIVEDTGFLSREADVRLVAGASAVVSRANRLGVPVIIVSNQSGIGRGFFDWAAFVRVQTHITLNPAARCLPEGGIWLIA